MGACLYPEVALHRQTLITVGASERLLTRVCPSVYDQTGLLRETLATLLTVKGLLSHYLFSLHSLLTRPVPVFVVLVSVQRTAVWEDLPTELTGRGLYVHVDGLVPFQTHRTPIALVAYRALEGFQPCVDEQMAPKSVDLWT